MIKQNNKIKLKPHLTEVGRILNDMLYFIQRKHDNKIYKSFKILLPCTETDMLANILNARLYS